MLQIPVVNGTVNRELILKNLEPETTYGVEVFSNTAIGQSGRQRYQFSTGRLIDSYNNEYISLTKYSY